MFDFEELAAAEGLQRQQDPPLAEAPVVQAQAGEAQRPECDDSDAHARFGAPRAEAQEL